MKDDLTTATETAQIRRAVNAIMECAMAAAFGIHDAARRTRTAILATDDAATHRREWTRIAGQCTAIIKIADIARREIIAAGASPATLDAALREVWTDYPVALSRGDAGARQRRVGNALPSPAAIDGVKK